MPKKDFSFHYDIKTKTGTMTINEKYINLSAETDTSDIKKQEKLFCTSSSGGFGYGINLI